MSDETWPEGYCDEMLAGFNRDLPTGADRYVLLRNGNDLSFGGANWSSDPIFPSALVGLFEGVQDQVMESVVGGRMAPVLPARWSSP